MGTSVKAVYAEKLQEDIRKACLSLEDIGFDSLVIVVARSCQTGIGSQKGKNFLESFDLVEEFSRYCEGFLHKEKTELTNNKYDMVVNVSSPVKPANVVGHNSKILHIKKKLAGEIQYDSKHPEASAPKALARLEIPTQDPNIFEEASNDAMSFASCLDDNDQEIHTEHTEVPQGIIIPKEEITILEQESVSKPVSCMSNRNNCSKSSAVLKKKTSVEIKKSASFQPDTHKKTYSCDQCDKQYLRFESLTYHKRSRHTGERPYVCRTCGKNFVSRNNLRCHKAVHSDSTPFVCNVCGQLFKRGSYLWRHRLTHSDARYGCDICGRQCCDKSSLNRHKKVHTGEKPHCCENCGQRFTTLSSLDAHKRVHTGEKPFTCEICGERFRRKKNMVTHQRRRH